MPEPLLDTTVSQGQTGHEADHDILHAFHNAWVTADASRTYLPADFLLANAGGSPTWITQTIGATTATFTGDISQGSWTDLGSLGTTATVTG